MEERLERFDPREMEIRRVLDRNNPCGGGNLEEFGKCLGYLDESLELIRELKPKKAYLTHISHQLGFHNDVSKELPENVFLAYDGLNI